MRTTHLGYSASYARCPYLAQQWKAKKVVGVDIDPELIRGAWRKRRTVWSMQEPTVPAELPFQHGKKRKRQDDGGEAMSPKPDYFPMAMEHMFGSLPIPSSTSATQGIFPHNIIFRSEDWVQNGLPEDTVGYDVVLAYVSSCHFSSSSMVRSFSGFRYRNGFISTAETRAL